MPEGPKRKVYPGLWAYIRFHVELALCDRCIAYAAEKANAAAELAQLEDAA